MVEEETRTHLVLLVVGVVVDGIVLDSEGLRTVPVLHFDGVAWPGVEINVGEAAVPAVGAVLMVPVLVGR